MRHVAVLKSYRKLSSPDSVEDDRTPSAMRARGEEPTVLENPSTKFWLSKARQYAMDFTRNIFRPIRACLMRPAFLPEEPEGEGQEAGRNRNAVPPPPEVIQQPQGNGDVVLQAPDRMMADVVNLRLSLERQLVDFVGADNARNLVRNSVRQSDYVILSAREDAEYAGQLRDSLYAILEDVAVAGPWDIQLGDNIMNQWENMLRRSGVIVVLVSRAYFQARLLSSCCSELMVLRNRRRVVPIYLEGITDCEYPGDLRCLLMLQGLNAQHSNAEDVVQRLVRWAPNNSSLVRYLYEIRNLGNLLHDIALNPDDYLRYDPVG